MPVNILYKLATSPIICNASPIICNGQEQFARGKFAADKKDVPILASALEAKARFLVTFNVKDSWPDNSVRLEVVTPKKLLSRIRSAASCDLS